jgi:hypothetical protein
MWLGELIQGLQKLGVAVTQNQLKRIVKGITQRSIVLRFALPLID